MREASHRALNASAALILASRNKIPFLYRVLLNAPTLRRHNTPQPWSVITLPHAIRRPAEFAVTRGIAINFPRNKISRAPRVPRGFCAP